MFIFVCKFNDPCSSVTNMYETNIGIVIEKNRCTRKFIELTEERTALIIIQLSLRSCHKSIKLKMSKTIEIIVFRIRFEHVQKKKKNVPNDNIITNTICTA